MERGEGNGGGITNSKDITVTEEYIVEWYSTSFELLLFPLANNKVPWIVHFTYLLLVGIWLIHVTEVYLRKMLRLSPI